MTDEYGQTSGGEDAAIDRPTTSGTARRLPQMLDLGEVAEMFSRSRRTIRWWIASGRLRSVRIGNAPFVPASEIDALLAREPSARRSDNER